MVWIPLLPLGSAEPLRTQLALAAAHFHGWTVGRKGLVLEKGQGLAVLFSSSKTEKARGNHPGDKLCRGQVEAEAKNKVEEPISLELFILRNSNKHSSERSASLVRARTTGLRGRQRASPQPMSEMAFLK